MSHAEEDEEEAGRRDEASSSSHFTAALPGLPDELAVLCIARVPSFARIWCVSRAWRRIVASSALFQRIRREVGLGLPLWLYALLKMPPSATSFEWHAYDPLARVWHPLPPLPIPVEFHLSSPSLIGHTYSVQCASSTTRLFMVAACRLAIPIRQFSHLQAMQGSSSQVGDLQSDNQVGLERENQMQVGGCQGENELQFGGLEGQNPPLPAPQRPAQPRFSLEPALPCPLIFNTISNSWSISSPLFYGPRCWCATGIDSSGKLYVASGCGKLWDLNISKSAELYDPELDMWTPLEGLRSSKFSGEPITAVNYEGKLHMASGRGVFGKVGLLYDPEVKRWMDMPRGMRGGWTGACVVVDGTLLALDESAGRLRLYQSGADTWLTLVEHPMLKGLEQLIAAPGSRICGIMRSPPGSLSRDSCHPCGQDFIRVVHLSPSPTDSDACRDGHISCQLSFVDIFPPAPNVSVVALQLLSSMPNVPS